MYSLLRKTNTRLLIRSRTQTNKTRNNSDLYILLTATIPSFPFTLSLSKKDTKRERRGREDCLLSMNLGFVMIFFILFKKKYKKVLHLHCVRSARFEFCTFSCVICFGFSFHIFFVWSRMVRIYFYFIYVYTIQFCPSTIKSWVHIR